MQLKMRLELKGGKKFNSPVTLIEPSLVQLAVVLPMVTVSEYVLEAESQTH